MKNKIDTQKEKSQPSTTTSNLEGDELEIRTFEEELWSDWGDELLKECQRRLREMQPGSRFEMDRQEELEVLDHGVSLRMYRCIPKGFIFGH